MAVASELGIDLTRGYLFRPTDPRGNVVDKPFAHPAAESRLKSYLAQANLDEGETLHSFRSGCAITLAMSGVGLADVMGHIGWRSDKTALYYLKLSEVLRVGSAPGVLSDCDPGDPSYKQFTELDNLKLFSDAFPNTTRAHSRP